MEALSERLEVRLSARTLDLLREESRQRNQSIAQLVRVAIEKMLHEDRQQKLDAAEALFKVNAPVTDWPAMKEEIEAE